MLTVLGIKNVEKLIPSEDDIKLVDPVQENQNVLCCKPVKALPWQDHESHIRVHSAAMQDPLMQQLIGQNPKANQIVASMTAHIAEHVGFAYRNRIQQVMGISLPSLGKDDELTPAQELQLSKMLSMAAPAVLQQSQQMVAQQQAQKNAQDPVLVAQKMEQETKREEVERKKWRDREDIRIAQEKLNIEARDKGVDPEALFNEQQLERDKATADVQIKQQESDNRAQLAQQQLRHQQEKDGVVLSSQLSRDDAAMQHEEQRNAQDRQIAAARTNAELQAKRDEAARADARHKAQMKQNEERHRAEIEAKKKMAAASAAAASKPKPKGGDK
jgi:hypothetical protein